MLAPSFLALIPFFAVPAPHGGTDLGPTYHVVPLARLVFEGGALPPPTSAWREAGLLSALQPYAVLTDGGEVWIGYPSDAGALIQAGQQPQAALLALRVAAGAGARGTLYFPGPEGRDWARLAFSVPASAFSAADAERTRFHTVKAEACARELDRGGAGAAWFRHQMRASEQAAGLAPESSRRGFGGPWRRPMSGDLQDTYDVFSGGRAVSENLQLERVVESALGAERTVALDTLQGITTRELDWTERIAGLEPELDPLAALVPADQHALFFPGFAALLRVVDETAAGGTPVLELLEPRAEDARTFARYERQLCLPLTREVRELGGRFVQTVAITGSDPYLRTGADVAVLLGASDPVPVGAFVAAQQALALATVPGAKALKGTLAGLDYTAVVSPDRRVSSYVARVGDALVVTNSAVQLERIARVHAGEVAALSKAPEYVFFRDRYPRGAADESGFLVLTDATIRRWCSPRWRIGASRRTLAAALIADAEAERLAARAEDRAPVLADTAGIGLALERDHIRSELYGTLDFLTPIVELDLDRVAPQEQESYERFRVRYQANWRAWFDPIAVRVHVAEGLLDADLTVMPLIAGSDYNEMIEIGRGVALAPLAGDPHAGAIAHWAMAVNTKSGPFGSWTGMASSMAPELGIEPFNWMAGALAVYAEDDPFWQEWAEAEAANESELFVEDELYRLPVVLHVPVRDPLRLAAFLTTLRAFSNQAAPGLAAWETRQHGEQPYVRITPTPASGFSDGGWGEVGLCYAALPDALIVTLREDLLQRAIDRRGAPPTERPEWLGQSYGLRLDQRFIAFLTALTRERQLERMQLLSWSNLPALNAWRRELRADDAAAFHEQAWGVAVRCPGGGEYRWNEAWQTYESTVYGHPAEPRAGPSLPPAALTVLSAELGLTFEEDGLRSRARIVRGTH